jgi:hypothetical protein
MKKKLRLIERDFISLLKKIVLENTDDMDDIASLTQREAEQQQKLAQPTPIAQPRTQRQVDCIGGYKPPTNDVYGLCSGGPLVGKLQQYLGFPKPDNKFGPITRQALFKKTNKTTITKDEIEKLSKSNAATSIDAVGTTSKSTSVNKYNPVGPLKTLNGKLIKISNSSYAVESIYASYRTNWKNGEFTIYINVIQGSFSGSKKYKFATNCSLLENNIIKLVGKTTEYYFNDYNVTKAVKTHFCQIKSNKS